jgi:hypothetical protein
VFMKSGDCFQGEHIHYQSQQIRQAEHVSAEYCENRSLCQLCTWKIVIRSNPRPAIMILCLLTSVEKDQKLSQDLQKCLSAAVNKHHSNTGSCKDLSTQTKLDLSSVVGSALSGSLPLQPDLCKTGHDPFIYEV